MSRALDHPVRLRHTGRYCPDCRAGVDHDQHRITAVPESGMPPNGEYAPEHEPEHHREGTRR